MERLNSADIENIMSFCKKAAEIGANPKKVFACDSKTLTFDGCVFKYLPSKKVRTGMRNSHMIEFGGSKNVTIKNCKFYNWRCECDKTK